MYREWKQVCLVSWTIFFFFELSIILDKSYSIMPLCTHDIRITGTFYNFASAASLGGFFFTWISLFAKIIQIGPGTERIPTLLTFNVVSISFLSKLLIATSNWGGTCVDSLGYIFNRI